MQLVVLSKSRARRGRYLYAVYRVVARHEVDEGAFRRYVNGMEHRVCRVWRGSRTLLLGLTASGRLYIVAGRDGTYFAWVAKARERGVPIPKVVRETLRLWPGEEVEVWWRGLRVPAVSREDLWAVVGANEGISVAELAERLGVPVKYVYSRVRAAGLVTRGGRVYMP